MSGVDQRTGSSGDHARPGHDGPLLRHAGDAREAILNESYASRENLGLGDTVTLGGKKFTVSGSPRRRSAARPRTSTSSSSQLQKLSDREGRVNTVYVRAESSDDVAAVAAAIEKTVDGASVTTAEDLADRVSGTLVDAKNLAGKLGTALMVVGLLSAFLIASLLTLSSVTKRIRELGTLKALGWSQRLVVRQVTGESLAAGAARRRCSAWCSGSAARSSSARSRPSLEATVAAGDAGRGPRLVGRSARAPSSRRRRTSRSTHRSAPASILGAVGLALLGGLVAGAVGSLRAARLRPADALRHID